MDNKTFIVQIVNTVAWPIVILVSLWIFKESIKTLINSLSELKIGNNSALFDKKILVDKVFSKNTLDNVESSPPALSEEDVLGIPDNDYEFMREIAKNKNFMPTNKNEVFKYNSLVNHGYFEKEDSAYKPTKKGTVIIDALKSMYY